MKEEEIIEKLQTFHDYLEVGNIWSYCLRWMGWFLIQSLAWLVDGLEGITDSILGIKTFFNSPDVQGFIKNIQPFLYVLLAFSLLYIGYLLIMNKKLNREQIAINLFISIGVIVLLNVGMLKADKFTDKAVEAVDLNEEGTTSEKIIKDGITDVAQLDVNGWKTTNLKKPNKVPQKNIKMIDITEKIDDEFKINDKDGLSDTGKQILKKKLALNGEGKEGLAKLDNGWFDFFPEQYYRWHWDFWTIAITLFVTGMTLLFITIKLAKLCYELAFNSILAQLLAPADVADGQKLKQVLKSIMNTFLIIIMIFISMKVYLMGTQFISDKLDGIAYLIALIAISIAVVDGPVMCERIFGIDAGLKSGWAAVAGGMALAKGAESALGSLGKGGAQLGKLAKSGVGGLSMAGGGVAGMAAGLAKGSGQGEGKQDTLPEQMKKAMGQGQGKGQQEGQQGKGSDLSAHIPGQEQENGKMGQGQSQASGLHQGSSLQEEMKEAESKEGLSHAQDLSSNAQDEQNGSSIVGSEGSGGPGTTSLQDEMKASEGEHGASTTEGASVTQGLSQGKTTLHDEMKAVEGKGGLSSSQGSASLSNGGAKGVGTPSVQGGSSLQQEVKASGGTQGSSSSSNGGSRTVDTPSVQGGSNLQQEIKASGGTQESISPSNGGSQTIDTPSVQGSNTLQQEMNTSGGVQEISSPSNHGSQTIDTPPPVQNGTTLHEEIASTGNASSYTEPSEAPSTTPSVTHASGSVPLQEDIRQAESQVAATQEHHTVPVSSSAPVQNTSSQEVIPSSTQDIPMPNQQRTETRHIGQVIRDKASSAWNGSKTVQQTKRTYQIGRNTGEALHRQMKPKQNKKK